MTYYLKFNKLIYKMARQQLLLPAILGLGCYLRIVRWNKTDYIDYILLLFFLLVLVAGVLKLGTLLYWIVRKKPALTVNEMFICDHYKKIKYLWNDMEEAVSSNDDLEIKLYDPVKYVDHIANPLKKLSVKVLYRLFGKKPAYYINFLDFLDTDNEPVLKILNDYSIRASA